MYVLPNTSQVDQFEYDTSISGFRISVLCVWNSLHIENAQVPWACWGQRVEDGLIVKLELILRNVLMQ